MSGFCCRHNEEDKKVKNAFIKRLANGGGGGGGGWKKKKIESVELKLPA